MTGRDIKPCLTLCRGAIQVRGLVDEVGVRYRTLTTHFPLSGKYVPGSPLDGVGGFASSLEFRPSEPWNGTLDGSGKRLFAFTNAEMNMWNDYLDVPEWDAPDSSQTVKLQSPASAAERESEAIRMALESIDRHGVPDSKIPVSRKRRIRANAPSSETDADPVSNPRQDHWQSQRAEVNARMERAAQALRQLLSTDRC